MFWRSRQLMMVLLLFLVALAVGWGCGSGDTATTTTSMEGPGTTLSPTTTAGASDILNTKLKVTDATPPEYVAALAEGHPVVMLFYVPGGADDVRVLDSITKLRTAFREFVFLIYDYKTPSAYGDLSTLLKVNYPPELVLVDRTGVVRQIWNGYVDEGSINQNLVDLRQQ